MSASIMEQGQRLAELWSEINRLSGEHKEDDDLLDAAQDEAFAIEKRIAAMRATSPEEALLQLRIAASYLELESDEKYWNAVHLLVWSATWALNGEFGQRIPFADKYSPPRMDPAFVETKQRAALDRQAGGGAA